MTQQGSRPPDTDPTDGFRQLRASGENEACVSRVAVCVATCQRPQWLHRLLFAISQQVELPVSLELLVIVCDNAPTPSVREIVLAFANAESADFLYVHEPRRGIPFARNAAVDLALASGAEAIVFIDDDEVPNKDWLASLIRAQQQSGSDVVTGGVTPSYDPETPPWVIQGSFFERPTWMDGAQLQFASTNNTLVLRGVFEEIGRFNEQFRLNGGDDTEFFLRARLAGARISYAANAAVSETVPLSRARALWLIKRAFRLGNSFALCERTLLPWRTWAVIRPLKVCAGLARGLFRIIFALGAGKRVGVKGLQDIARAIGAVAALTGYRYQEYKAIHGR